MVRLRSPQASKQPSYRRDGFFMAKKLKLLITDKIDTTKLDPLRGYFDIDTRVGIKTDELLRGIASYHTIITRSSTALPKEILTKADNLKIIGRAGIGVDNIDIFEATKKSIAVLNAPKGNARVTAEHTIGLLFALFRHVPQANADLKKGIWGKSKYVGTQVYGKTLGIIGFGNVGKEVYRLAHGIGMDVVVCEPYVRLPKQVRKVTFEELLKEADILTFHVPHTYLTTNMLNRKTLELCKKGVYIINCSRGAVVEETAILEGLTSDHIAGFAVDVFVKEPKVNKKLLQFPNVIATPHIAGSTIESQRLSIEEVVSGIIHYLKGQPPSNLLNPQVFKKRLKRRKGRLTFDAVIFDCDSTLSGVEGIDELARQLGKGEEVAKLTKAAMDGTMNFEQVYERRFSLVHPSREHLHDLGKLYIEKLVTDAKGVIEALTFLGKDVYIVSGGFSPALLSLGKYLGIPEKNIFGNDVIHDENGKYIRFVEGPLRRNHGKLQIIRQIPGKKLVVGDSITDLETIEYVDLFVGYGGVTRREKVERAAPVYVYAQSLTPILILAGGFGECVKLLSTKYRKYVGKGLDLLMHPNHVKVEKNLLSELSQFKDLAYYNG